MTAFTTTESKPLVNYIFVDYENVHEVDLSLLGVKSILMEHATSVQLVRLNASGKNRIELSCSVIEAGDEGYP